MFGNKDLYHVICFVELAMGSPTGTKPKSLKERTEWAHFLMTPFSRKNVFLGYFCHRLIIFKCRRYFGHIQLLIGSFH